MILRSQSLSLSCLRVNTVSFSAWNGHAFLLLVKLPAGLCHVCLRVLLLWVIVPVFVTWVAWVSTHSAHGMDCDCWLLMGCRRIVTWGSQKDNKTVCENVRMLEDMKVGVGSMSIDWTRKLSLNIWGQSQPQCFVHLQSLMTPACWAGPGSSRTPWGWQVWSTLATTPFKECSKGPGLGRPWFLGSGWLKACWGTQWTGRASPTGVLALPFHLSRQSWHTGMPP